MPLLDAILEKVDPPIPPLPQQNKNTKIKLKKKIRYHRSERVLRTDKKILWRKARF